MSKGEKRIWVPLLPSMPKGEIVGMFYRQRMLVIDGCLSKTLESLRRSLS
jgi:hypothetical protein